MSYWKKYWPEQERRLKGWLCGKGYLDKDDRAEVLAQVKAALLKLLDREPDKSLDKLRAYAWATAKKQVKQCGREHAKEKNRPHLELDEDKECGNPDGHGYVEDAVVDRLDCVRRPLLRTAAHQHAVALAQGNMPDYVELNTGRPSVIDSSTPKAIGKKEEYFFEAIKFAPQKDHVRHEAKVELQRLLDRAQKKARLSFNDVEPDLEDLSEVEEMEVSIEDEVEVFFEEENLSSTARDCATLLHYLMPRLSMSEAMDTAVAIEKKIYGGPNTSPKLLSYTINCMRPIGDAQHRRDGLRAILEKLWRAEEGDMFLQPEKDEMPLVYLSLDYDMALVGLPAEDCLPEGVRLTRKGKRRLEAEGYELNEDKGCQTYEMADDTETLDDLNAMFVQACDLAREVYGLNPVDCECIVLEVDSEAA